jgi:hypothetical protein
VSHHFLLPATSSAVPLHYSTYMEASRTPVLRPVPYIVAKVSGPVSLLRLNAAD